MAALRSSQDPPRFLLCVKARHIPLDDGLHTLAIEYAGRLVGPEEEDLLNEDDDFVTYARAFHPVELKLLEARYHLRVAHRSTRSEPLVTFHLSAAFSALASCYHILQTGAKEKEYQAWWSQTRKRLNADDGWQLIKRLRNRVVHHGLDRFKVHPKLNYVERPDRLYIELAVDHVEIDGQQLTTPFQTCADLIDLLLALVQEAQSKGFLKAPKPDGRTLVMEFFAEDEEGNRRSVEPDELETTKHLQQFGIRQSIRHAPQKGSDLPAGED